MATIGVKQSVHTLPRHDASTCGAPRRHKDRVARLLLGGSSVVRLLDSLQADGLVERREDDGDRRAKAIALTPRGQATVDRVEAVARQVRDEALAGLPPEDIETAFRVLDHVCRALDPAAQDRQSVV